MISVSVAWSPVRVHRPLVPVGGHFSPQHSRTDVRQSVVFHSHSVSSASDLVFVFLVVVIVVRSRSSWRRSCARWLVGNRARLARFIEDSASPQSSLRSYLVELGFSSGSLGRGWCVVSMCVPSHRVTRTGLASSNLVFISRIVALGRRGRVLIRSMSVRRRSPVCAATISWVDTHPRWSFRGTGRRFDRK